MKEVGNSVEEISELMQNGCKKITTFKSNVDGVLFKHIEENPSHVIDWDNMKILDTAKDKWPLLLKEMLHIKKFKTRTKCTKELKIIKHVNWKQIQ